jgi:hypothetical protein
VSTPVIDRRVVTVGGSGHLLVEASDARLRGFPPAVAIAARDGSLVTYTLFVIDRDREGDIMQGVYRHESYPPLIIFND